MKNKEITADRIHNSIMSNFLFEINIILRSVLEENIERSKKSINKLFNMGYSFQDISSALCDEIYKFPISEVVKAGILNIIADADFEAINSIDFFIHTDNLLYKLSKIKNNLIKAGVF